MDKEKILEAVPQEEIMQYYFPYEIDENRTYLNPFRSENDKDKSPGCKFYRSGDTLIFKDFTHPDLSGDCFKICSLSTKTDNFQDVLRIICRDFNLKWKMNSFSDIKEFGKRRTKVIKKKEVEDQNKVVKTNLVFATSALDKWGKHYWENLELEDEDIEKWKISKLDSVVVIKTKANGKTSIFKRTFADELAFCFDYGEDVGKTGYIPNVTLEKRSEFYKSVPFSYVMGIENLVNKWGKPDYVLVTKGFKDLTVLDKINVPVVSLQNETPRILNSMKLQIESLCKISPILLFDNDNPGSTMVEKLAKFTGWPYIELDYYIDPAEYVEFGDSRKLKFEITSQIVRKKFKTVKQDE